MTTESHEVAASIFNQVKPVFTFDECAKLVKIFAPEQGVQVTDNVAEALLSMMKSGHEKLYDEWLENRVKARLTARFGLTEAAFKFQGVTSYGAATFLMAEAPNLESAIAALDLYGVRVIAANNETYKATWLPVDYMVSRKRDNVPYKQVPYWIAVEWQNGYCSVPTETRAFVCAFVRTPDNDVIKVAVRILDSKMISAGYRDEFRGGFRYVNKSLLNPPPGYNVIRMYSSDDWLPDYVLTPCDLLKNWEGA